MTDTDALLATVRQVASQGERAMIELGWTSANVNWRAALDSLAKEIERLRAEVNEWRDDAELKQSAELERETQEHRACGESLLEATAKWEAAEAELERVKAENAAHGYWKGLYEERGDQIDKALSALRYALPALQEYSIGADNQGYQTAASALHEAHEVLARCIAEIEGEA